MEIIIVAFLVLFVVLPLALCVVYYNKFITLRNYVKEAFATMDVYMKKRWDLIPNLVETAKGYMQHESQVFEKITELRNLNYGFLNDNQKLEVNKRIGLGLSNLIATAENYPDLKANENFINLQNELSEVEGEIADARKYYNGTVREYNTSIQLFPAVIVANLLNFKEEKLFEIEEAEKQNVKVQF